MKNASSTSQRAQSAIPATRTDSICVLNAKNQEREFCDFFANAVTFLYDMQRKFCDIIMMIKKPPGEMHLLMPFHFGGFFMFRKGCCVVALNVKQEAFCLHYAKSGNATEAYKKAGYNAKTENAICANATRLLRNDKIQARLKELAEELASDKIASIREIQEYLTSVMRRELKECVVVTLSKETSKYVPDDDGKMRKQTVKEEYPEVVQIPACLKDANKAAETLAKMQGGFDSKLTVDLTVPVFGGEDELED